MLSAAEIKEFEKLYNEAANISPEAVDFLESMRSFTRKGDTCFRSAESMRKKLYAKYPEHMKYTDEEASNIDTAAGAYTGMSVDDAVAAAERDGFSVTVKGEGSTVTSQNPATGSTIPTGGTIVLYTDESSTSEKVTVPNLVGFGLSEVNDIAASYSLNVSVTGTVSSSDSTSTAQSVPEGTEVAPGTVITVTFSSGGIAD